MHRFISSLATCLVAVVLTTPAMVQAQNAATSFPAKPIRIVTPFPAGGSADVLARLIGEKMSETWKQPVVVDSRPGGNTLIAATNVAQSPPDGYTLLVGIDFMLALSKSLYRQLPFDPDRDFTPVSMLASQPLMFIVNPKTVSAKTFPEMVSYSKANPGKLNVGIGAIVSQLVYEEMKVVTGTSGELINYRGSQPTTTALVAGDVGMSVDAPVSNLPFIKDGRIVALAVTSHNRMPSLPQTPSVVELGFPSLEMLSWFCLVAPAKTPPEVITKINQEVKRILALPDVQAKLSGFALTATSSSPEELQTQIKSFSDKWAPVVKRAGIRLD